MSYNKVTYRGHAMRRRIRRWGPIGTLGGVLTGSAATMIGMAAGLEPYVIFCRSSISAILIATLISFGLNIIYVANTER